ncbi:hypothetical protein AAFF_G00030840 [Aldrovandia affinis]|uniref:Uncharacterized protein n=1 Tax=Aldrovandia affinis TaxID=143900 RepID=A0AAD7S469_9TELE|nr:hypothetical protein AAFF_G00030840 [Aldrovandia affinis]
MSSEEKINESPPSNVAGKRREKLKHRREPRTVTDPKPGCLNNKRYTVNHVVTETNGDVVTVARAMHRQQFARRLKKLFDPEREAAVKAIQTGTSVQVPCAALSCGCKAFAFIPSRPEEVGEFWLRNRPGFDPTAWRATCRCQHSHEQHTPATGHACTRPGCRCVFFESSFLCASCDKHWEEHQTFFDTEDSRKKSGLPYGEAYLPFVEIPALQNAALTGREEDEPAFRAIAGRRV